ncbi:type I-U CRISPR-associated protein Csx17 [Trichocoleus sp. DQ-A3]
MAVTGKRGFWQSGRFYLEANSINEIVETFLLNYCPKPIAAPWNKASGFLKTGGVNTYLEAKAERWSNVATTFKRIQDRLEQEDLTKSSSELKLLLYPVLRRNVRERSFQNWLASALLIREVKGKPKAEINPLLGTGGNVSTVDLGATYLSCCETVWDLQTGDITQTARTFVEAAIANVPLKDSLVKSGILCHLSPIADFLGELHNTSEVEDYPGNGTSSQLANPVDFILAIEGLLNFSGNLSELKDGEFQGWSIAVYPLLLEVNSGSADTSDRSQLSKYEVWLPIWNEPMGVESFREDILSDLRFRLAEQVNDTIDFLQLLANCSEDLKFNRYARFGFWRRKGQGNYAIHIGLAEPGSSDIGSELRQWRKFIKPHPQQSNQLYNLLMALEQSLTALAKGTASIQELLILLGRVELTLSDQNTPYHPPQPRLSEEWAKQAYAEKPSPEFRLAAALASADLRRHISKARYSPTKNVWFWSKQTHPVRGQSLTVLADDLMRQWDEDDYHPSERSHLNASLTDIQQFIEGALDETRILELAFGLSLCQIPNNLWKSQSASIPAAYKVAARLLWDKKLNLNRAAINGLRRGSTIPLQSQARKQQINLAIPPTTSNGQCIATALIFPVKI